MDSLAPLTLTIYLQVRPGRVGAGLPAEPWNDSTDGEDEDATRNFYGLSNDACDDILSGHSFRGRSLGPGGISQSNEHISTADFVTHLDAEEYSFTDLDSFESDQSFALSYSDQETSSVAAICASSATLNFGPDDDRHTQPETRLSDHSCSDDVSSTDIQPNQDSRGPPLSRSASSSSASCSDRSCSSISEEDERADHDESSYDGTTSEGFSEFESDCCPFPLMPAFQTGSSSSPLTSPDESMLPTPLMQFNEFPEFPWNLEGGIGRPIDQIPQWSYPSDEAAELVDGVETQQTRGGYTSQGRSSSSSTTQSGYAPRGRGSGTTNTPSNGWGKDDDDDEERRPPRRVGPIYSSSSSPPSPSESEDESDDYGQPSANRPEGNGSSDDDVPLAQRIPTALKAQRSIRVKDKAAREQRRQARNQQRERHETLRPTLRSRSRGPPVPPLPKFPQDAVSPTRTQFPSSPTRAQFAPPSPTRGQFLPPPSPNRAQFSPPSPNRSQFPPESYEASTHATKATPEYQLSAPPPRKRAQTLLPTRVHTQQQKQPFAADDLARKLKNVQAAGSTGLSRHATTATGGHKTLEPMRSLQDQAPTPPAPQQQSTGMRQRSKSMTRPERRTTQEEAPPPMPSAPRTSTNSRTATSPPMSHVAPSMVRSMAAGNAVVVQQRIFIGDMQSFNLVEVGPSTSAGDVISMIEDQGSLKGWQGTGGWMLHECAQDFGMGKFEINLPLNS